MIIGDAILPQTSKNDQKCGSEFVALLWRHLTPQRKKRNIGAQLQVSQVHNSPKDILENLHSL